MVDAQMPVYDILQDDLSQFAAGGPAFVTFGEVLVRDTPADSQRPERTRLVHLSMAGSEYNVAIGLRRLGIPSAFITRVPDNPYGLAVRNIAREHGVNTDYFAWAPRNEPIGRYIYESGCTPRRDVGIYQRMYSAASRLDAGMVDWSHALADARLVHVSGISFGLAEHSRYDRNYNDQAFREALAYKPSGCVVGMDLNYRSTLWSLDRAREVLTPIIRETVDILITTVPDMAQFYGIGCGPYSASQILAGEAGHLENDDLRSFAQQVREQLNTKIIAVTMRYPDSFEIHRWESAAVDADGNVLRSPAIRPITLRDRLGGGDAWTAGFYYGLLTEHFSRAGIAKGVLVGDACTRWKQTMMFDLPVVDRVEIQELLNADEAGLALRTSR
jgi:2-dehydro-3-deoxygluconokinase